MLYYLGTTKITKEHENFRETTENTEYTDYLTTKDTKYTNASPPGR